MKRYLLLGGILFFVGTQPALAYIDPVTGSVILQAVIGGSAAALVAIKNVRERIVGFFRRKDAADVNTDKDGQAK